MFRFSLLNLTAPALLGLTLLGSCTEKFLDEQPKDSLTTANFYRNQADAIAATNACYGELRKGGNYGWALWAIDIASDNSTLGGGGGGDGAEIYELDNFTIPATNPVTSKLWTGCYVGIGACNVALQKIPGIPGMDATIQKRCLGEAQFLRAKYYFDLIRAYGDVPLLTVPPATPDEARAIARTPVAQVYTQIEKDLAAAADNLLASYSGDDLGRATKGAAQGLLAKVYLTEGKKTEAAAAARLVISSNKYSLNTDYGDNFNLSKENGPESLFEVQYKNGLQGGNNYGYTFDGEGSARNEFFGPRGQALTPQGGYGFNIPEPDFVNGYESGDKRKAVTIFVPGDSYPDGRKAPKDTPGSPNGYNVRKWFVGKDPAITTIWDSPLNVPVLRYAEVLLILAEAAGPTTEGLGALNQVRTRAGLPAVTTTNASAFEQAVWKERRYELAFEDDRWFDLKRTGRLLTLLQSKGIKSFNVVFPIPQSEIDSNPTLKQNTGY